MSPLCDFSVLLWVWFLSGKQKQYASCSVGALDAGNPEPTPGLIWWAAVVSSLQTHTLLGSVNFKHAPLQEQSFVLPAFLWFSFITDDWRTTVPWVPGVAHDVIPSKERQEAVIVLLHHK